MRLIGALKKAHGESALYFRQCRVEIARTNGDLLYKACGFAVVLQVLHALTSFFIFHDLSLLLSYCIFFVIFLGFFLLSLRLRRQAEPSYPLLQTVCALFILALMAFITVISVFPFPDRPAIFFPIFYLMLSSLFFFPWGQINLVLTLCAAIFLVLCRLFKVPETFHYDVYATLSVWVFGLVMSYLMLDLRLREGISRQKLQIASSFDEITGLHNRRAFNRYLEEQYPPCARAGRPAALILIDIDDFKAYNDHLGHLAGDRCLALLGQALLGYAQTRGLFAARYGGEELVVALFGDEALRAEEHARAVLALVHGLKIQAPYSARGQVTVSLGAALEARALCPCAELLERADRALYQAKRAGKDRVAVYGRQA